MSAIAGIGFNTKDVKGRLDALAAELDRAVTLGASMAEITATGLDAVSACRVVPERASAIADIMAARPLTYSMHAPIAINLMDEGHSELHIRAARASLDLAALIGASPVVLHPGRVSPGQWTADRERLLAVERAALTVLGDHASSRGLKIAYENISPNPRVIAGLETSYSLDPSRLAEQLDAVGHTAIVACLDVSHAQQGAGLWGFDLLAACHELSRHIGHIHFSDSTGVPATVVISSLAEMHYFGVGDMHAPPGWGSIDFDSLARSIAVHQGTQVVIELKSNFVGHSSANALTAAQRFAANVTNS